MRTTGRLMLRLPLLLLSLVDQCMASLVLTVLRHAETEWNVQGRLQGSADSPLTPRGVCQAELCAKRLQRKHYTAAYCSPLLRAKRTAELVVQGMDDPPTIVEDDRLRERAFGMWEGMVWEDIQRQYPDQVKLSQSDATFAQPGGGESRADCLVRALDFLDDMTKSYPLPEDHVLVVTHSATAVSLVKHVLGLPPAAKRSFNMYNLAINTMEYDAARGSWMLSTLGDCAHLGGVEYLGGATEETDAWRWS